MAITSKLGIVRKTRKWNDAVEISLGTKSVWVCVKLCSFKLQEYLSKCSQLQGTLKRNIYS